MWQTPSSYFHKQSPLGRVIIGHWLFYFLSLSCGKQHGEAEHLARFFVPIELSSGRLSLIATPSSYAISLSGCDSSFASTATEASNLLEVYKDDTNCLAKLDSFNFNGKNFVPSIGDPFTTWQNGDTATFEDSSDSGNTLRLKLTNTLSNPVEVGDTVSYEISEIEMETGTSLLGVTSGTSAAVISAASDPPSFTLKTVELVGVSAGKGGVFTFTLECTANQALDTCVGVDLTDLSYILVEDSYSSAPSLVQLNSIFSGGGQALVLEI